MNVRIVGHVLCNALQVCQNCLFACGADQQSLCGLHLGLRFETCVSAVVTVQTCFISRDVHEQCREYRIRVSVFKECEIVISAPRYGVVVIGGQSVGSRNTVDLFSQGGCIGVCNYRVVSVGKGISDEVHVSLVSLRLLVEEFHGDGG